MFYGFGSAAICWIALSFVLIYFRYGYWFRVRSFSAYPLQDGKIRKAPLKNELRIQL